MVLNFNFNIINNILYLTLINAGQVKRGELKSSGLVAGGGLPCGHLALEGCRTPGGGPRRHRGHLQARNRLC